MLLDSQTDSLVFKQQLTIPLLRGDFDVLVWNQPGFAIDDTVPPIDRSSLGQLDHVTFLESQLALRPASKIKQCSGILLLDS